MRIGVIGGGMVGHAVARGFMESAEVRVFDTEPDRRTHGINETLDSDFVFLCLPTPARPDGSCDLETLKGVCESLRARKQIFVLKSTVPPGTTTQLAREYALPGLVHSPEFLTARRAVTDFQTPSRNLIGYPGGEVSKAARAVYLLYVERFPGIQTLVYPAEVTEMVKLAQNAWAATKISFFNEMHQVCEGLAVRWDQFMEGLMSDGRIAHSHTEVPGPDGKFGFGGACLPKDTQSLAHVALHHGVKPVMLEAALERNSYVREVETHARKAKVA